MFVPFVGAWIALREQPVDVETEAYVALAGPVVGLSAHLSCICGAGLLTAAFCWRLLMPACF